MVQVASHRKRPPAAFPPNGVKTLLSIVGYASAYQILAGFAESAVHELREDLERSGVRAEEETNARLARAAEAMLADYSNDRELTALTALDGEAFHV